MEKDEKSTLRLAAKHTVGAVTAQRSSDARDINPSIEDEIRQLRRRNQELEAENAILKERETAFVRDAVETFNTIIGALRAIRSGKETAAFFVEAKKKIEATSPEDRLYIANAMTKQAATMIREAPAPLSEEGEARFTYSVRTRTENRAFALLDYMKRTETPVLKSTEARHVLQGIEGKPLDRKIVHRALNVASRLIRASSEVVGGVSRIVLQSTASIPCTVGGGGGRPVHPDWISWRYVTPPDGPGPLG